MASTKTIRFSPPQPCMTWNGEETCGNPATVATLTIYGKRVDFFAVCEKCTRGLMTVYGIEKEKIEAAKASEE